MSGYASAVTIMSEQRSISRREVARATLQAQ